MAAQGFSAESAITAVATLQDDLRRSMYAFVRRVRRPVTREEAAATVGISRKLAGFHLDKLVDVGLLTARYAAVERKVGRAPKVYELSGADVRVNIPQRQPEMLAEILLDAVLTASAAEPACETALRAATDRGREIGAAARASTRPGRLGAERALTLAVEVLERHGFEPVREETRRVGLRTCPFHPQVAKAPELVCRMNRALLAGVLDGMNATTVEAVLNPRAGECCVQLCGTDSSEDPRLSRRIG